MPIGKDSIQKRVAKVESDDNIAPELVATTAAAPAKKASPAKNPARTTASKKPAQKKPAEKKASEKKTSDKPAQKKTEATAASEPTSAVLTNVAPEVVEKVIGHKENEKYEKVQIGDKMPTFLM